MVQVPESNVNSRIILSSLLSTVHPSGLTSFKFHGCHWCSRAERPRFPTRRCFRFLPGVGAPCQDGCRSRGTGNSRGASWKNWKRFPFEPTIHGLYMDVICGFTAFKARNNCRVHVKPISHHDAGWLYDKASLSRAKSRGDPVISNSETRPFALCAIYKVLLIPSALPSFLAALFPLRFPLFVRFHGFIRYVLEQAV